MYFDQMRLLRGTAVFLLAVWLVGSFLISWGLFDPKPIGSVQAVYHPDVQTVATQSHRLNWLDVPLPDGAFSVRVTAVYQSGEPDSLYGLALGNDDDYFMAAVSPLGYVTVAQKTKNKKQSTENKKQLTINNQQLTINNQSSPLFPLQPWPHVHTGTLPNEIWVDVVGEEVTVRINRELLWVGRIEAVDGQMGVVGVSFGETAVFDFQSLAWYQEENHE